MPSEPFLELACHQTSPLPYHKHQAHSEFPQFSKSFFSEKGYLSPLNECELNPTGDKEVVNSKDSIDWFLTNVKSYYKSNLKIAHLNINSLLNKLDEVKNMLNRYLLVIPFIFETKLTASDFFLRQSGYRTVRQDRKKGAGGILPSYVKIYPYVGDAQSANQNLSN